MARNKIYQGLRSGAFLLFLLMTYSGFSQTNIELSGQVVDAGTKSPLAGVNVALRPMSDSSRVFGNATGTDGKFKVSLPAGAYRLRISYLGYVNLDTVLGLRESRNLGNLYLKEDVESLGEVQIKGEVIGVIQKGDTTEFNADGYKVNTDADAGELVKKMPGITIENGTLKAQGEEVKKVTVDGQEFFGDDAMMVLKNLPAEIVDKIQVFDRLSDQAQLTGFDDGNSQRSLNIVTKSGKNNGQFGKAYAGYGTDNRYQAGFNFNIFKAKRRISLIGMSNSINQQNFSSQDLLGVFNQGGNNRGGGMRGPGGGGRGGWMPGGNSQDPSSFLVGGQNGITTTHSLGINYVDVWGTKWKVSGSYFISSSSNQTLSQTQRSYFSESLQGLAYFENQDQGSSNINHRFQARLEFSPDTMTTWLFLPRINTQGNLKSTLFAGTTGLQPNLVNEQSSNQFAEASTINFNPQIVYRRRFKKEGRSLSLDGQATITERSGATTLMSGTRYFGMVDSVYAIHQLTSQKQPSRVYQVNAVWTENVNKLGQLMFNYNFSFNENLNDRLTHAYDSMVNGYTMLDTSLSNTLETNIPTHRAGVSFRVRTERLMMMAGFNGQYADLNGVQTLPVNNSIGRQFVNFLPSVWGRYKLSGFKQLRFMYRTSTQMPSVSQLQEVVDNSNPLSLSVGNARLEQQYQHALNLRYNYANTKNLTSLFAFVNLQQTNQYISNVTYIASSDTTVHGVALARGAQLSRTENLGTYRRASTFASYSFPLRKIKSNMTVSSNMAYSSVPSRINGLENRSNNMSLNGGVALTSNISEDIDFSISYNYEWNDVKNTLQAQSNNRYVRQTLLARVNWLPVKSLVLYSDISYQFYNGRGNGTSINQEFILWNPAVGYKFGKNKLAELRVSVFDALNQNVSISRNITETYLEDNSTNLLTRYYMLTLTWQFRHFKLGENK